MNKTVIISGGVNGIGFATAQIFAQNYFNVFVGRRVLRL